MSDNKYHQVLCSLTEEEYHQHFNLPDTSGRQHPPLLYQTAENTYEAMFEDDITLIVRDALVEVSDDDAYIDSMNEHDRDSFNAAGLPFALKVAVLSTAKENWQPPQHSSNNFESSYWYGDNQTARTLFADHPELKTIFESTPDEVTAAWQRRMSLQPTH